MLAQVAGSSRSVVWVKRIEVEMAPEALLRKRAGVEDTSAEVRVESLDRWGLAVIPAGSKDEWGATLSEQLNVGYGELPPEGRVYLVSGG